MRYIDCGGGLAVDYDGSFTDSSASMSYTLQHYANDGARAWGVAGVAGACLGQQGGGRGWGEGGGGQGREGGGGAWRFVWVGGALEPGFGWQWDRGGVPLPLPAQPLTCAPRARARAPSPQW